MPWQGYLLILVGAFLWGVLNVTKKKFLSVHSALPADVVTAMTMVGAAVLSLGADFLWVGMPAIQPAFWLPFAATAVLNVGIMYGNNRALQLADASLVVPIAATMPLFAVLMAFVILGEWPTFWGRIGILLIAMGSYVLNLQGAKEDLPARVARILPKKMHEITRFYLNPWLRLLSNRGVQVAFGVAYLGAMSVNFDKLGVLYSDPLAFTGLVFLFVAIVTACPRLARGEWARLTEEWRTLLLLGALQGISASLMNAGYYYAIVPYVGSLKRTQIFWTILLAGAFLHESHMSGRLLGAAILYIGVALLAF